MSASLKARRRLAIAGSCALALIATAAPRPAAAASAKGPPWLKLDRAVAEPSWLTGVARLRLYVSAVTLQGGTIEIHGDKEWTLELGSSKKKLPYLAGRFKGMQDDLAIAVVICASGDYAPELPKIKKAVEGLIDALPKEARVQVVGYADEVNGDRRPSSKNHALSTLAGLDSAVVVSDLQLIKAVRYAVHGLRKAKPSEPGRTVRKMIVVIGDGQDIDPSPERFRAIARRADHDDIRIHTLAWSPNNVRKPMLGLAELSKRTYGTFRLIYTKDSFGPNLQQLWQEIEEQYVLTFFVPSAEIENKRIKLLAKDMVSNDLRVKKLTCGDDDCADGHYCAAGVCLAHASEEGHGILGWILYIAGGAVALLVVLVGVGFVLTRRQEKRAAAAALAAAAVEVQANADANPNRIVPAGPRGGRAQAARAPATAAPAPVAAPAPKKPKKRGRKAAPPAPAAVAAGSLYVLSGAYQGQTIPLRHGFRVGKGPDCDLVLSDDGYASTHHAHFEVDKGGGVTLVDDRFNQRDVRQRREIDADSAHNGNVDPRRLDRVTLHAGVRNGTAQGHRRQPRVRLRRQGRHLARVGVGLHGRALRPRDQELRRWRRDRVR